jgi:hypothetical protein
VGFLKNNKFFFFSFLIGIALLAYVAVFSPPKLKPEYRFLLPPKHMKHFTLGYSENVADGMWIRVIQDLDVCELTKNRKDEYTAGPIINAQCRLGWVYSMLDAITELSPRFYPAYLNGALMLTVIVNDDEGSGKIFEKGLERFPNDWRLNYYAAYLFISSLNRPERAAELLVQAGKNGAPQWVHSLAARLYTESGKALLAKTVLENILEAQPDERFSQRIRARLDAVDQVLKGEREKALLPQEENPVQ